MSDTQGFDGFKAIYNELKMYNLEYPLLDVEYMRYLCAMDMNNGNAPSKEVLMIASRLHENYPEISYIQYYCGQIFEKADELDKAEEIYKSILGDTAFCIVANVGIASILEKREEYSAAKEIMIELIDHDESNHKLYDVLNSINKNYIEALKKEYDESDNKAKCAMEMAWCYFQLNDFDNTLKCLELRPLEEYDNYDYVNLKGRSLNAMNRYEEALPLLYKWQKYLLQTVDDGTREARKKLNRISFSYFTIGKCQWHVADRNEAIANINKGIELEEKLTFKLAYKQELAELYAANKEWDKAIQVCTSSIEEDEDFFPAYVTRQKCYFEQRNVRGVIDDFFTCIDIYPDYVRPYVYAMKVFFLYKDYDNMIRVYDKAKEHNLCSDEMELYYIKMLSMTEQEPEDLAEQLEQLKQLRETYYKKISEKIESDLDEIELIKEMVFIYWGQEEFEKAVAECESGLEKYPDTLGLIKLLGDMYAKRNQNEKAIEQYNKYISIKDDWYLIYLSAAKCYEQMDEMDNALEYAEESYELNPEDGETLWYLGRINYEIFKRQFDRKYYDRAIHFATLCIEKHETSYNYNERGIIHEEAHDLEKALEDYLKAESLENNNLWVINNIARVYRMLRKDALALSYMEKALKLDFKKNDVWVYSNMAKLYEHRGEHEKAWQYTLKQLELNPESYAMQTQLARQYKNDKKYEEAIEVYKQLYNSESMTESEALNEIGEIYLDKGEMDKALECYIKSINCAKEKAEKYDDREDWNTLMDAYENLNELYLQKDKEAYAEKITDYNEKCFAVAVEHVPNKIGQIAESLVENFYELGDFERAKKYAKIYFDELVKKYGSIDAYLNDKRFLRVRAIDVCTCYLVSGEMELAEKYLRLATEGYLCCHCKDKDCYEAYFLQGIYYEIKGDIENARRSYEKSIEIYLDSRCKRRLSRL